MIKTAFIFAAGKGERMRPLTLHKPKPLIEIAGKTLLQYNIDMLQNFERIIINAAYLGEQIEDYVALLGNNKIIISREPEPLETGGALKFARHLLGDEPILCLNSDVIFTDNIDEFISQNNNSMLLVHRDNAVGYHGNGDFSLNNNAISREGEKNYIFTGAAIFSPKLLDDAAYGEKFSLREIYFSHMHEFIGLEYHSKWLHVGDIAGIKEAEQYYANK